MGTKQRSKLLIISFIMAGFAFWASTFAGAFINEDKTIMLALYFFGLAMIMTSVLIGAISFARLERRIAALEGDPELPPKPVK